MTLTQFEADLIRTELMKYQQTHPQATPCDAFAWLRYQLAPHMLHAWDEAVQEVCS